MSDPTNTGDMFGHVANALNDEHHYHADREAHALAAHGNEAAHDHSHVAKLGRSMPKAHVSFAHMIGGSQRAENYLDHILSNVHRGDAITRQAIKTWMERNSTNTNENPGLWDQTVNR